MAWRDLPKGQRIGIVVAIPLIIVGVFAYLTHKELTILGKEPAVHKWVSFLYPADNKLGASLFTRTKQAKEAAAVAMQRAALLEPLKEKLARLEKQRDQLNARLSPEKEKTKVRVQLQEMLDELRDNHDLGRIEFDSVSVKEEKQGASSRGRGRGNAGGVEEVLYKIRFRADMNGLIYYANRVENSHRFMAISNLVIKPGGVKVDRETTEVVRELHDITLEIKTYVYPDEEAGA